MAFGEEQSDGDEPPAPDAPQADQPPAKHSRGNPQLKIVK